MAEAPEGQELIHAVSDDHDVVSTRVAGRAIRNSGQLTMNEKLLLTDLLLRFTSMRKYVPAERVHSDAVLYNQFLQDVFKNWSSNQRSNPAPVWREPKFSETSIEVGVLRVNHPKPGSTVIPDLPTSPARAAGAPAFLGLALNLEEGSYAFLWRDMNCKFINPKYVRLDDEFTIATARAAAIDHYDGRMTARIMAFDTGLVISAARRRIRKWAVYGSSTRAALDDEDIVTAGEARMLVLATDFLAEYQVALQETMQNLSERDPFILSFH